MISYDSCLVSKRGARPSPGAAARAGKRAPLDTEAPAMSHEPIRIHYSIEEPSANQTIPL